MSHHHRGGNLHQSNKTHSGYKGHASKRSLKRQTGGRVIRNYSSTSALDQSRRDRRNHSNQLRLQKRREQLALKRSKKVGGPHVVAVVAMHAAANLKSVIYTLLKEANGNKFVSQLGLNTAESVAGRPITASYPTYQRRFTFIEAARDLTAILDAAKVADSVIFVVPVDNGGIEGCCDDLGILAINTLTNQGMSNIIGVLQGLDSLNKNSGIKKMNEMKKYGQRLIHTEFGEKAKTIGASNSRMILRALTETPIHELGWRKTRSYFPVQKLTFANTDVQATVSDVALEGYLQGLPLSANQLIHVTGCGTFQVRHIKVMPDPCPFGSGSYPKRKNNVTKRDANGSCNLSIFTPSKQIPDLAEMVDADSAIFASEQTWPTAAEINGAHNGSLSEDDDDTNDATANRLSNKSEDHSSEHNIGSGIPRAVDLKQHTQSMLTDRLNRGVGAAEEDDDSDSLGGSVGATSVMTKNTVAEDAWGNEIEVAASERVTDMEQRRREEREDLEFPDEVDVPLEQPAHERFARYRGLESFRTSPWDPKESLPLEYARIFQFSNFRKMEKQIRQYTSALRDRHQRELLTKMLAAKPKQKQIMHAAATAGFQKATDRVETIADSHSIPGQYIAIVLKDVPKSKISGLKINSAIVVSSLLPHEQRLSVVHCRVKRHTMFHEPLKTKDLVHLHCGFRRRVVCPLWSENNLRCDKHKLYRYFQSGDFGILSAYFPITYAPAPVTVFKATRQDTALPTAGPQLAATGSVHCTDPDRIILKRIMLTGYPMRVHGMKAIARMMFFNSEDIRWFAPVTLRTKYGLIGHIKEPVGVHGYMKCNFNKPIKNNDTICLNLYKRMYPKLVPQAVRDAHGE